VLTKNFFDKFFVPLIFLSPQKNYSRPRALRRLINHITKYIIPLRINLRSRSQISTPIQRSVMRLSRATTQQDQAAFHRGDASESKKLAGRQLLSLTQDCTGPTPHSCCISSPGRPGSLDRRREADMCTVSLLAIASRPEGPRSPWHVVSARRGDSKGIVASAAREDKSCRRGISGRWDGRTGKKD
jgi:hypothetical protein